MGLRVYSSLRYNTPVPPENVVRSPYGRIVALFAHRSPASLACLRGLWMIDRMPDLGLLVNLLQLAVKDRTQLALENIALRHQLAVYKRSIKRPIIKDGDRIFWLTVMRMLKEWREALVFVQPETLIRWHRNGFRYYWRRKSRANPGRPAIDMTVIALIRRLSQENVT